MLFALTLLLSSLLPVLDPGSSGGTPRPRITPDLAHVNTHLPLVALTFDDGPSPQFTPQILALLQAAQVPATFFVVGREAVRSPRLVQELQASGFEVGNHTWNHIMRPMTPAVAALEVHRTDALLQTLLLKRPRFFRPPGGELNTGVAEYAQRHSETVVTWNVDPRDYARGISAARIVDVVLRQVQPGSVILMHDGGGDRSATVEALGQLIPALRARGFTFVSLQSLCDLGHCRPAPHD